MSVCRCGTCQWCQRTAEREARAIKVEREQQEKRRTTNYLFHRDVARAQRILANANRARRALDEEEVNFVRAFDATGRYSRQSIADAFGVGRPVLGRLLRGDTYRDVPWWFEVTPAMRANRKRAIYKRRAVRSAINRAARKAARKGDGK